MEEGARQNQLRRNRAQLQRWVDDGKVIRPMTTDRLFVAGKELWATYDDNGNPDDETIARLIIAMTVNGIEPVTEGETWLTIKDHTGTVRHIPRF